VDWTEKNIDIRTWNVYVVSISKRLYWPISSNLNLEIKSHLLLDSTGVHFLSCRGRCLQLYINRKTVWVRLIDNWYYALYCHNVSVLHLCVYTYMAMGRTGHDWTGQCPSMVYRLGTGYVPSWRYRTFSATVPSSLDGTVADEATVPSTVSFSVSVTTLVLTPTLTLNDPLRPNFTTAQHNYTGFNHNS